MCVLPLQLRLHHLPQQELAALEGIVIKQLTLDVCRWEGLGMVITQLVRQLIARSGQVEGHSGLTPSQIRLLVRLIHLGLGIKLGHVVLNYFHQIRGKLLRMAAL